MNRSRVAAMSAALAALTFGAWLLPGEITTVTFKTSRNVAFL